MNLLKNGRLKYLIFAIFFLAGLFYVFFNDSGILKYLKLRSQIKNLHEQISDVDRDNKHLQAEIDSLQKKVPAKIEKIAREKYNMIRKGEKTIQIIEK